MDYRKTAEEILQYVGEEKILSLRRIALRGFALSLRITKKQIKQLLKIFPE